MTSKLYVSEFESPAASAGFPFPVACEYANSTDQAPLDYSGGHAESSAFAATTKLVRIHTDSICCVAFGKSPTATTNSRRMAAGQTEYYFVRPGDKVSAVITT